MSGRPRLGCGCPLDGMVATHPFDCRTMRTSRLRQIPAIIGMRKFSSKETLAAFHSMALQSRPLAQPTRGDVPVRSETDASAALPACGTLVGATATKCHQCGASMRFFIRRGEQVPRTLDAADLPGHVRHAYDLLRDVWPVNDHFCANAVSPRPAEIP